MAFIKRHRIAVFFVLLSADVAATPWNDFFAAGVPTEGPSGLKALARNAGACPAYRRPRHP